MSIAAVSNVPLPVEPGGESCYELTIRNTGTVVDAFTVQPLGEAASWIIVEPAELPLFPGAEGTVLLRFRPPKRFNTPAGEVPWAVRITSREDPSATWVEEGRLQVAPFTEVNAEVAPITTTARGTGAGKAQLAIDNRGNLATEVRLYGGDDNGNVSVDISPRTLVLQPGTAQVAKIKVRAKKGFWKGSPKTHPYKVVVDTGDGAPQQVPATLLQDTIIPGWIIKLLIGLLVLALLLSALWFTVLQPTISSAVGAAAAKEAKAVAKEEAKKEVAKATGGGALPGNPPADPGAQPPATPPAGPDLANGTPGAVNELGAPFNARVTLSGSSGNKVLSPDHIVSVTDLFFQNPEGDAGTLEVRKGGDVIYLTRLNFWRDLDQHSNAPFEFKPGEKLEIRVKCENPGGKTCTAGVSVTGYKRKPAQ